MSPQVGRPLVMETPAGLVRIEWDTSSRRRKLRIIMPGCFTVHRGDERALKGLRFLKQDEKGKLVPNYGMLVPVVGDDGAIQGVQEPAAIKIGQSKGNRNANGA